MKKLLMILCLSLAFGTVHANEDTDTSPAGKAEAIAKRPFFGCVVFENIMNDKTRSIGKGTVNSKGQLSFQIQGKETWTVSAELTGWGAFGAAFNLKVDKSAVSILNGHGIGYIEFTHYINKMGKNALSDFSAAKENSVDGILNHVFCSPMSTINDIK